jgi:hypothetical protein
VGKITFAARNGNTKWQLAQETGVKALDSLYFLQNAPVLILGSKLFDKTLGTDPPTFKRAKPAEKSPEPSSEDSKQK